MKQLHVAEADGVLAHELAHFSGADTFYSKKTAPLLAGYQRYLEALYRGGIGRVVFYFMNCFRSLFELSLGKRRREREFRADRIAAEITSPRDVAGALLRITAYSKFRNEIQLKLFEQERILEIANIAGQIAEGFSAAAVRFAAGHDIGELKSSHPFDSHPPLADRLEAIGVPLSPETAESLLAAQGDGGWYRMIDKAEEIERQQWDDFEAKFRSYHEATLPYRFLPETDEECAIVVKAFPAVTVEGKAGSLALDHQRLHFTSWKSPIAYREITQCAVNDGVLQIHYQRDGKTEREAQTQHVRQTSERSPRRHQPLLGPLSKCRGVPGSKTSRGNPGRSVAGVNVATADARRRHDFDPSIRLLPSAPECICLQPDGWHVWGRRSRPRSESPPDRPRRILGWSSDVMVKRCDRGIASTPSTPPSFLAPQHRPEPHARGRIGLEQSFVEPSRPTTWPAGFPADSVDLATLLGIHGRLLGQRSHGRSGCPMILSLATVIPKAEISPA